MSSHNLEIFFATLVALQNTNSKSSLEDSLEKSITQLQERNNEAYNSLDSITKARVSLINMDGDATTAALMDSFELVKGELPEFIEEDVIVKALELEGHIVDDLEKGRLNIANLTPVRRQIVTSDGRVYTKTVYVKKEEMSHVTSRGRSFLAQHELEKTMRVGDSVRANFLGWSSGTQFQADDLKISRIDDDKVTLTFVKEFTTPSGHKYGPAATDQRSRQIVVPRTTSSEWNEKTSFMKKPEPVQTGPVNITDVSQVSVGDKVLIKNGDVTEEATVKYVHPQGDFIKVQTADGQVLRRTLNKVKKPASASTAPSELTEEVITRLKSAGVEINITYPIGQTDLMRVQRFNQKFPGFNLEEWLQDTNKAIKKHTGADAAGSTVIMIQNDGGFNIEVSNSGSKSFEMNRKFNALSDGRTEVYHALFKMDKRLQGKSFGKEMLAALHKQYMNSGIPKVRVSAGLDKGGYVWGKFGFTCSKADAEALSHKFTVGKTNSIIEGYSIRAVDRVIAQEVVRDFYREHSPTTRFPVRLLCNIGPNNKGGKVALMGAGWAGELDLTNNEQRTNFENYMGYTGT